MGALNHARVGFKHKGNLPPEREAQRFIRDTHQFLTETSTIFFGIDFDAVSEADMVGDEKLRELLKSATASLVNGDLYESLKRCCDAVGLIDDTIVKALPLSPPSFAPRVDSQSMAGLFEWTAKNFISLERALALHIIGCEPNEYWLLKAMVPAKSLGGSYQFSGSAMAPPINADSVRETLRIAVQLALRVEATIDRLSRMGKAFVHSS
jgi:hypothetical protein